MGLREQKKLATRQALAWAALRLAVQRGLDNVHVEDIAAAAGVSPRTYNNYFASKQEAICSITVDRAELIGDALLARPAGEPLVEALAAAMLTFYQPPAELDREWVAATQLVMRSPALRGEALKAVEATERRLAQAIAQRCGLDVERDLYPLVVAAVVSGAARAGIHHWQQSGTTAEFGDVLASAIRMGLGGIGGERA
ncbi:MAG TPA: TetR family transcriptional regulator [Pseudonocardiaceae bacterium]|nr:TetR family transcriptional regulator [Pseudonocardiaceae bacterium]